MSRKLERKWRSNNSVEYLLDWKNSVRVYKKALHKARAAYYSKLIEENKSNPRFLFSTVARLTESHSSTEPSIPRSLNTSIFMTFFNDKILTIRNRINHLLPSIGTNTPSSTECGDSGVRVYSSLSPPSPFCSSPAGGVCGRGRGWLPRCSEQGTPATIHIIIPSI